MIILLVIMTVLLALLMRSIKHDTKRMKCLQEIMDSFAPDEEKDEG